LDLVCKDFTLPKRSEGNEIDKSVVFLGHFSGDSQLALKSIELFIRGLSNKKFHDTKILLPD